MTTESPTTSSVARLRAVICDDSALNRDCLALALQAHNIDAECAWDLPSFLARLDQGAPDLIVLNIGTADSATLLQVGLDLDTDTRVIVTGLSPDNEADIVSCAEGGVAGLHLKNESLPELLTLIHETADAEPACSQTVTAILMRHVYALVNQPHTEAKNPVLTKRENEILQLLEQGLSNQQIASRMYVSVHTVRNHARSLFSKLGVNSRGEAVAAYRAMRYAKIGSG